MNLGDPASPETQPAMQPKRTFPWDYTINAKRQNPVPELKAYTPRNLETISGNIHDYPSSQQTKPPRDLRFSLDNPAFDEREKRDQEYVQSIPPKDVEPGLQRKFPPSSPEKQKNTEKKNKNNCKYCALIIIVIILLLLLLTMTGLFIWRMVCCNEKNDKLLATPTVSDRVLLL